MSKIFIFGHKNPDTDSITSSLVMENFEKALGNDHFKAKEWDKAVDCYTRAMKYDSTKLDYNNQSTLNDLVNEYEKLGGKFEDIQSVKFGSPTYGVIWFGYPEALQKYQ